MLRATDIDRSRSLRIRLSAVDVGPRGRMQDEVDRLERRRRERDVPLLTGQAKRLGKRLEQGRPELPAGPGYEDASRAERIGDDVLQR